MKRPDRETKRLIRVGMAGLLMCMGAVAARGAGLTGDVIRANEALMVGAETNVSASGAASLAQGSNVTASGAHSLAAGVNATASHDRTFVWSGGETVGSTTSGQFTVHASGGIRLLGGAITATNIVAPDGSGFEVPGSSLVLRAGSTDEGTAGSVSIVAGNTTAPPGTPGNINLTPGRDAVWESKTGHVAVTRGNLYVTQGTIHGTATNATHLGGAAAAGYATTGMLGAVSNEVDVLYTGAATYVALQIESNRVDVLNTGKVELVTYSGATGGLWEASATVSGRVNDIEGDYVPVSGGAFSGAVTGTDFTASGTILCPNYSVAAEQSIIIEAGAGVSDNAGHVTIRGGNGQVGLFGGGNVTIEGGAGDTLESGNVTLRGGSGTTGGDVTIEAGVSWAGGEQGNISLTPGVDDGNESTGVVSITRGNLYVTNGIMVARSAQFQEGITYVAPLGDLVMGSFTNATW